MTHQASLFRFAAVASLLSALTTLILIYGPDARPTADFAASAQQHSEPMYLYKRWVLFFHPQFSFLAATGIAAALFRKSPVLVTVGLFYYLVWAVTEMTQQAYIIDALNQYWRPAYLAAESAADKAAYFAMLKGFGGISDSLYFVLLFGFGLGSLLFGCAFLAEGLFEKCIGLALIFIGALSLAAFTGYYLGPVAVTQITGWLYEYLYGPIQTAARAAIGFWLWQQSRQGWSSAG